MNRRKILILDDEPGICSSLKFHFEDEYTVFQTQDPAECLDILREHEIDVLLLDLMLGDTHGHQVLREARRMFPDLIVIIMTAYGTIPSTVESMKAGAFSYLTKPVDLDELGVLVKKGLEYADLHRSIKSIGDDLYAKYAQMGIVGRSRAMEQVMALIEKVRDIDSSILVTGESGTGKELVARAIHYGGKRRGGRFEAVNCAAIPRDLIESELFGYEKGAFTGAVQSKPGRFMLANGGTLFLDEISELDLLVQSKLLRALQEKEISPLGSTSTHRVDVRIIAATNKKLASLVKASQFRDDLFYRLNVINIDLPPLRERCDDLPILVSHFIRKQARLLGKRVTGIEAQAYAILQGYSFPGNVRELENIIERAVALAEKDTIRVQDLPDHLYEYDRLRFGNHLLRVSLGEPLHEVERRVIMATLERLNGSRKEACRMLGISERGLRNKLARYRVMRALDASGNRVHRALVGCEPDGVAGNRGGTRAPGKYE
ncbi:MAG: sigma-54-dependent Fis family transcriptional regulator [Firmicutes bacterium]|nr:sigma-54-dependent Fis family transcriptional regulator [Bacillota bacterium]